MMRQLAPGNRAPGWQPDDELPLAEQWHRLFLYGVPFEHGLRIVAALIERGQRVGGEEDWQLALRCLDMLEWQGGREPQQRVWLSKLYDRLGRELRLAEGRVRRHGWLRWELDLRHQVWGDWSGCEEGWECCRALERSDRLPALTRWLLWDEVCRRLGDDEERLLRLEEAIHSLHGRRAWLGMPVSFWRQVSRAERHAGWGQVIQDLQGRLVETARRAVGLPHAWWALAASSGKAVCWEEALRQAHHRVGEWARQAEGRAVLQDAALNPASPTCAGGFDEVFREILHTDAPAAQRCLVETATQILRAMRGGSIASRPADSWREYCRKRLEYLRQVVFEIPDAGERALALMSCAETEALWMESGWRQTYHSAFRHAGLVRDEALRGRLQRRVVASQMHWAGWHGLRVAEIGIRQARRIGSAVEREQALQAVACSLMRYSELAALDVWRRLAEALQEGEAPGELQHAVLSCWCAWLLHAVRHIPLPALVHHLIDLAETRLPDAWRPVAYLFVLAALAEADHTAHEWTQPPHPVCLRHAHMLGALEDLRCRIALQCLSPERGT